MVHIWLSKQQNVSSMLPDLDNHRSEWMQSSFSNRKRGDNRMCRPGPSVPDGPHADDDTYSGHSKYTAVQNAGLPNRP